MSDEELRALPSAVNLPTAARALGIGTTKAYELARAGDFPCRVLAVGSRFRVARHHLFEALGVPLEPAASASSAAQPAGSSPEALSSPAMPLPEGGVRVVLVLQAVLLPGDVQDGAVLRLAAGVSRTPGAGQ